MPATGSAAPPSDQSSDLVQWRSGVNKQIEVDVIKRDLDMTWYEVNMTSSCIGWAAHNCLNAGEAGISVVA